MAINYIEVSGCNVTNVKSCRNINTQCVVYFAKLDLIDTAASERYHPERKLYLSKSNIDSKSTFKYACKMLVYQLKWLRGGGCIPSSFLHLSRQAQSWSCVSYPGAEFATSDQLNPATCREKTAPRCFPSAGCLGGMLK